VGASSIRLLINQLSYYFNLYISLLTICSVISARIQLSILCAVLDKPTYIFVGQCSFIGAAHVDNLCISLGQQ
jgi:hypothetical protein